jgi:hypothetical protein
MINCVLIVGFFFSTYKTPKEDDNSTMCPHCPLHSQKKDDDNITIIVFFTIGKTKDDEQLHVAHHLSSHVPIRQH